MTKMSEVKWKGIPRESLECREEFTKCGYSGSNGEHMGDSSSIIRSQFAMKALEVYKTSFVESFCKKVMERINMRIQIR